ncbi:MAG: M20/M25/M40 family metallo-hydrolase [Candidatus Spechtbacterales bacterium]|nr:M20/M25/M40 family metallo-hydrolase [Candidatus Spechtbacterales bacterium]
MNKRKFLSLFIVFSFVFTGCATASQDTTSTVVNAEISQSWQDAAGSITPEEITAEITYLASRQLEGRRAQTRGSALAADFIARHLEYLGLKPVYKDYFQEFAFSDLNDYHALKKRFERAREHGYSVPDSGKNVIAMLEGTTKKNEYIILTAHYDHMGLNPERTTGEIKMHLGADDNASGTAALMEIAEAFDFLAEQGIRPQRSIIFLFADAEEWGLLGSKYFAQNPPVPIENIVAAINMDMLSRNAENTVNVIASPMVTNAAEKNPDLYAISKQIAQYLGLQLNLPEEAAERQVFFRSDHYSFFEASPPLDRMPVIFYSAGLHPDYHTSRDTADKINNKKVAKIAQFIFLVTLKVAQAQNAPDYIE